MRLTVIGCGRLGAPYAAGMADLGHEVLGVDTDESTIDALREARAPFGEPGLDTSIARNHAAGRLRFTDSYQAAAEHADLHFLAVGTPQQETNTAADLRDVERAATELAQRLQRDTVIIGKSSVPVGTTARVRDVVLANARSGIDIQVGWCPDFLRESTSMHDVHHPDRIVLGIPEAGERLERMARQVWDPLLDSGVPLLVTNWATAELAKSAANALLATKTSFINVLAEVCHATGGDIAVLSQSLGLDPRIGSAGLTAGLGYGGSCLAKDLRAFVARAEELDLGELAAMFRAVDVINTGRRGRYVDLARQVVGGKLEGTRIGLWGASFKPGVDDVRDSPALDVAVRLHRAGADVRVYDPAAGHLMSKEHPEVPRVTDAMQAVSGSQLLMVLTDWPEFIEADPGSIVDLADRPQVIDARTCLKPDQWRAAGWTYHAIGSPRVDTTSDSEGA
jgi:UDPglucose 6-dehydrogenase